MRGTLATLALAASVSVVAIGTGLAADLGNRQVYKAPPLAQTFNWTGFYVGAHIGGGWGSADWSGSSSVKNDGVIGGGQIGYNWQVAPNWVLGLEGDISGSGMKGNTGCYAAATCSNDINWLATVTGRFGYSFDRALIYAKGGLALAGQDVNNTAPGLITSSSDTRTGWTVGGGLEYAFAPAWSAKIEYNYMDFGTKTIGLNDVGQTVNALKIGVNYRFGDTGGRF